MNVMSKAEFNKLRNKDVKSILPVKLTSDGNEIAIIANPKDVIVVSDLHPFLQNKLRALEQRARSVMPPEKVINIENLPQ